MRAGYNQLSLSLPKPHFPPSLRLSEFLQEPAFLRQARGFLFCPLLPREPSKRDLVLDRVTGSKPERLRSGSLQADLSLIV